MLDTRTLSPIERLLTGSSSALEGGAGHIWDMYSGCQHEASHTKLRLESHLPKKMRRSRESVWRLLCSEDCADSDTEQMGAAANDRGVERRVSALHTSVGLGRMTLLEMYSVTKNST